MRREYRQSAKLALRSELMSGSGASGTEADRLPSRTVRQMCASGARQFAQSLKTAPELIPGWP